jgi:hypothetical protein
MTSAPGGRERFVGNHHRRYLKLQIESRGEDEVIEVELDVVVLLVVKICNCSVCLDQRGCEA